MLLKHLGVLKLVYDYCWKMATSLGDFIRKMQKQSYKSWNVCLSSYVYEPITLKIGVFRIRVAIRLDCLVSFSVVHLQIYDWRTLTQSSTLNIRSKPKCLIYTPLCTSGILWHDVMLTVFFKLSKSLSTYANGMTASKLLETDSSNSDL